MTLSQARRRRRMDGHKNKIRKKIAFNSTQRKRRVEYLKPLEEKQKKYHPQARLRDSDIKTSNCIPRRRLLHSIPGHKREVILDIVRNGRPTFKAKDALMPSNFSERALMIDALCVSNVQVLYLQNCGICDFLMKQVIKMVSSNLHIIALNLGETNDDVTKETWLEFLNAIKVSNICFLYVSESKAGKHITQRLKEETIFNRNKTSSMLNWRYKEMMETCMEIHKMWWNPQRSVRLNSIWFLL